MQDLWADDLYDFITFEVVIMFANKFLSQAPFFTLILIL